MTHSRTWKKAEQRVAALFGVRRRTGSGCDPRTGGDDIVHDRAFVEVRYRQKFEVLRWWREDAVLPALKENKLPVLVIFEKGDRQPFLVCPLGADYLLTLGQMLKEARSVTDQKPDADGDR